jgi:hypothetical protein
MSLSFFDGSFMHRCRHGSAALLVSGRTHPALGTIDTRQFVSAKVQELVCFAGRAGNANSAAVMFAIADPTNASVGSLNAITRADL